MNQRWYLAIDGGGSKIAVAAVLRSNINSPRSWHFEGTGSAHPSTWPLAADNLCRAIESVQKELKVTSADIAAIRLALAGAGRLEDQQRVIQTLQARCDGLRDVRIHCTGDIDPLVDYQTGHGRGIAVILGTGSVVASRNESGQLIRAGGWGPLLGDACSGGAIGLSALRYISQLVDEELPPESHCDLAQAVVREMHSLCERASELSLASLLIQIASDRTQTARLAGTVLSYAYQYQHRGAQELLEPHLADIVWQIRQVARRAGLNNQSVQLNFTGGLAKNHPPLRHTIVQACNAAGLNVIASDLVDPLNAIVQRLVMDD